MSSTSTVSIGMFFPYAEMRQLLKKSLKRHFIEPMEHIDKFEGKCKLFVWLCQIAKNTYLTYAKKQKHNGSEADLDQSRQTAPSCESEVLDKEIVWQLHKSLHGLKEPYKEVFSLRVFGELPFSQIGALLGKSDSWARLIFYRAKKALRRDLDETVLRHHPRPAAAILRRSLQPRQQTGHRGAFTRM